MSKKLVALRLSLEAIEILKKLAVKSDRSMAYIVETLIKDAAKKSKIK